MIKTEGLVRDENFRPIDGKYFIDLLSLFNPNTFSLL